LSKKSDFRLFLAVFRVNGRRSAARAGYIRAAVRHIKVKDGYIRVKDGHISVQVSYIRVKAGHIGVNADHISVNAGYIRLKVEYIGVRGAHIRPADGPRGRLSRAAQGAVLGGSKKFSRRG
jgi:hypothetical protein